MSGKHVVIVEDDADHAALMRMVLGGEEVRITLLRDGRRALDVLLSRPDPDLVILDLGLPGLDGLSLLLRLQEVGMTRRVPVLLLSSALSPHDVQRALDGGAREVLEKPSDFFTLIPVVRRHLADLGVSASPQTA